MSLFILLIRGGGSTIHTPTIECEQGSLFICYCNVCIMLFTGGPPSTVTVDEIRAESKASGTSLNDDIDSLLTMLDAEGSPNGDSLMQEDVIHIVE